MTKLGLGRRTHTGIMGWVDTLFFQHDCYLMSSRPCYWGDHGTMPTLTFIIAAPEMFDALEEVVKHGHRTNCPYGNRFAWDNDKCFCGVAQAEAAIAKAKGETR